MEYTNAVNDVNGFLIWILCAVYKYRKQVEPSLRTPYIYIYIYGYIFSMRETFIILTMYVQIQLISIALLE